MTMTIKQEKEEKDVEDEEEEEDDDNVVVVVVVGDGCGGCDLDFADDERQTEKRRNRTFRFLPCLFKVDIFPTFDHLQHLLGRST
jgi:hypothetical protein